MNETNTILDIFPDIDTESKENLQEQVDIIIHKLKFIGPEIRPKVMIQMIKSTTLTQKSLDVLQSLILIAGGIPSDLYTEATMLIAIQGAPQWFDNIESMLNSTEFSESPALQKNNLYIVKETAVQTSSPDQLLSSLETLAEIIQSKYFHYGREGVDWIKFDMG